MNEKLLKPYSPQDTEKRIYQTWEESGFFNPDVCIEKGITAPDAEPFSIVLPPPNVTGTLHLGHSFEHTMEDIVVRFNRMRGKRTLWIPGTDHAAIATQSKVEKLLEKEGIRKADLGRPEFLKRVEKFAQESHDTIVSQCKELGTSLDWSREAFTLDDKRNFAVRTAFKRMYDEGLIYRGHRIVNWDPKGQTVISDDELVYEERKAVLYTFKYSKDFPISISTTRPETKVGDTAVAVHPDDARYKEFIGREYDMVFCGVPIHIKIVADEAVEKEFGTGALGVTPAHSQIDAEIAGRHKLPTVPVINEYAKMSVGDERLIGKKATEAREIIAQWLRDEGLMEKEEEISQNVSTAERTGAVIEPLPKLQWFINVNAPIPSRENKTLKELMLEPIKNGAIDVLPNRFENVYYNWVENLRDWCISRQLWYGHRIPVWYDKEGNPHTEKEQKFLLARHGQTESNVMKVKMNQEEANDSPLTEKGIEEAKNLGQSLVNKNISKIIISRLPRSKETAEIVAKELNYPLDQIEVWDDYHEVQMGSTGAGEEKPKGWNPLEEAIQSGSGETLAEIEARVKSVYAKMESLDTEGTVLMVGHNAFHCCLRAHIEGKNKDHYLSYRKQVGALKNGSVVETSILTQPLGELTQDEDTLDTWFSSGLWSFSTLGWPNETADLKTYHPTSILMPGYEIIFFWAARMILMSQYLLGDVPFKTLYLHGIVRDPKTGKKFSKSAANGVEPLQMIEKYGADALRMAMVVGVGPGNDLKFDEQSVKAYGKFANKIWNITRFVLENTKEVNMSAELTAEDAQVLSELETFLTEITKEMEEYKFYLVGEKLYHYIWHTFADVIIERAKKTIIESEVSGDTAAADSARVMLMTVLPKLLTALHPFMPFITEEIWSFMPKSKGLMMTTKWPCQN